MSAREVERSVQIVQRIEDLEGALSLAITAIDWLIGDGSHGTNDEGVPIAKRYRSFAINVLKRRL